VEDFERKKNNNYTILIYKRLNLLRL